MSDLGLRRLRLALMTLGLFALAACATITPEAPSTGGANQEALARRALLPTSGPGARLLMPPTLVNVTDRCGDKPSLYVRLDEHSVRPAAVSPGQTLAQRFVYTMCPLPAGGLSGVMTSRIYLGGEIITSRTRNYRVTPGKWSVEFETTVPAAARAGVYAMEIDFAVGGRRYFARRTDFRIQ